MIDKFRGKYFFLSNFAPCKVKYGGQVFPTVEHAFQAAKCNDESVRKIFRFIGSPADAKKWGRTIKLREDWEFVKEDVMRDLIRQKFSNPKYKKLLESTINEDIVEGNSHGDRYWGVYKGEGQNRLGKIIMEVREEIFQK